MAIEFLTFTGLDVHTDLRARYRKPVRLLEMARGYPVELAVLVGTDTALHLHEGGGIFPPLAYVEEFKAFCRREGVRCALHLCGEYSRQVMRPGGAPGKLLDLCRGFGRVQVNLHGDAFDPEYMEVSRVAVEDFAGRVAAETVILQHRGEWDAVPSGHPGIEYLFDVSAGAGLESWDRWPPPAPDMGRLGYAGGLGPYTIGNAVDFAARYPAAALWFDMERRVRLYGRFNVEAAFAVCEQVWPLAR